MAQAYIAVFCIRAFKCLSHWMLSWMPFSVTSLPYIEYVFEEVQLENRVDVFSTSLCQNTIKKISRTSKKKLPRKMIDFIFIAGKVFHIESNSACNEFWTIKLRSCILFYYIFESWAVQCTYGIVLIWNYFNHLQSWR